MNEPTQSGNLKHLGLSRTILWGVLLVVFCTVRQDLLQEFIAFV
jgi:hypothetical protein